MWSKVIQTEIASTKDRKKNNGKSTLKLSDFILRFDF